MQILPPNPEWALEFIRDILGSTPWSKQIDIVKAVHGSKRITAVRSCFGAGKTRCAADVALAWLMGGPMREVITTAPTARQVRELLWKEIRLSYRRASDGGNPIGGTMPPAACELRIDDGWLATGFSSDEPVNFQGRHPIGGMLVIIDEAMGISREIWQSLNGLVVGANDRMLAIGNPTTADGPFYDLFAPDRSDVEQIAISVHDTPNLVANAEIIPGMVTRQWLEWARAEYGEDTAAFKSLALGEFPTDNDSNALIPREWITLANERWQAIENEKRWDRNVSYTLGLDVARLGKDSTIGALSSHQGIRRMVPFRKSDTMETVGQVVAMVRDDASIKVINIDADGLGAGIFDALRLQFGTRVVEMRGGMASSSDRYFNRRSEWYWTLRKALDPESESPIAMPQDDRLAKQLQAIHYTMTPKGQIRVESKDDIKVALKHSPDEADAVAYSVARQHAAAVYARVPVIAAMAQRDSDFYVSR